ncbi:hypothetical protein HDC94_001804 [Leifsonia sp. AK011]|uniref:hypothetical protein n=1 Tax=Leifsonia sp. AK011 TaxID=2723075 RepID=UPI0015C70A21|nr:hypothetical protein [Leifsonia sp. AK011]NYF10648.1 hypothetical protein [Leifsonia sp. AK011]
MMPWWSWVLIWTGLVVLLLVVLGLAVWWLFRKFLVLLDDVASLADRASLIDPPDAELVRPQLAILAEVSAIHAREDARRTHRAQRRESRRAARLARAARITAVDASRVQWPARWYARHTFKAKS